ncbi:hypothetical protein ACFOM8_01930 [Paracoccus angustae]|uniref:Phage tail protein n=1 Tax=Paracoccus angustae TaxID=1671480 RepID=A0ABV7TZW2_9RHOB
MALLAVAGSKLYIGGILEPTNEDFTEADFSGQTWLEVDGWETMGNVGDTNATITTALINRGRDVKQKGTANAGSTEMQFAALLGVTPDPGQKAMMQAAKSRANYAFKIELSDGDGGASPTILYFSALVMSSRIVGGGANTIQMRSFPLEINSNVVEVDAA